MNLIETAALHLERLQRTGVPMRRPPAASASAGPARLNTEAARPTTATTPGPARPRIEAVRPSSTPTPGATTAAPLRRPPWHGVAPPRRPLPPPRHAVTLDFDRLQREGQWVPMQTRCALAEEFRCIKRPLLRNWREAAGDRLSLILVTSALPGEGKTFCAINLAASIAAEIDTSVLLVDADVVHPQLMTRLGVDARKGLLDLLVDSRLELADVLLQTNLPNLTLLPAGVPNSLSTELLCSAAMQQLLGVLAAADGDPIVVFDAPPLLVSNEAAVLASHVGQVLLVVEAARTPAAAVQRAFAMVEHSPIVMSVLNKGRKPTAPGGKGYHYYFEGAA